MHGDDTESCCRKKLHCAQVSEVTQYNYYTLLAGVRSMFMATSTGYW